MEQPFKTPFLKPIKKVRQKGFSLTSGLTVRTSSRIKNYLHTKTFSVNWEKAVTSNKTLSIIRNWVQLNLMNNKPWGNLKLGLYQHLDGTITNIYRRLGRNTEWLHFKTSCSGITTKRLFQTLKQGTNGSILSSEEICYVKT